MSLINVSKLKKCLREEIEELMLEQSKEENAYVRSSLVSTMMSLNYMLDAVERAEEARTNE